MWSRDMKWVNASGKIVLTDLLIIGLPQTLNLFKKEKPIFCEVKYSKTQYQSWGITVLNTCHVPDKQIQFATPSTIISFLERKSKPLLRVDNLPKFLHKLTELKFQTCCFYPRPYKTELRLKILDIKKAWYQGTGFFLFFFFRSSSRQGQIPICSFTHQSVLSLFQALPGKLLFMHMYN